MYNLTRWSGENARFNSSAISAVFAVCLTGILASRDISAGHARASNIDFNCNRTPARRSSRGPIMEDSVH
jgi:hypothetical protein